MPRKKYSPYRIPPEIKKSVGETMEAHKSAEFLHNAAPGSPFVLLDMDETPAGTQYAKPQKIEPVTDEKQKTFLKMRKLAGGYPGYAADHAYIFYKQAVFMKDFEDDYAEQAPFSTYYPYYNLMDYDQLRTYFTWRTNVRKGVFGEIPLSYMFVYIYELLNNIGVDSAMEGLRLLLLFWEAYRQPQPKLDQYMFGWIKDYFVYYALPEPFRDFAAKQGILEHYPTTFAYETVTDGDVETFAGLSKYPIHKSKFIQEKCAYFPECFAFVIKKLTEKGLDLPGLIYSAQKQERWVPFRSALFFPVQRNVKRSATLSKTESYACNYGQWTKQTAFADGAGKRLAGSLLKQTEAALREMANYPYRLKTDKLTLEGIDLQSAVKQAVSEFLARRNRKEVKVNPSVLQQVRKEAEETKEKLLVEEEESKTKTPAVLPNPGSGWQAFLQALSESERQALATLIQGEGLKKFADENNVMLEVLIDGINQKAYDTVQDNVIEITDTVAVYEDYQEIIKGLVDL